MLHLNHSWTKYKKAIFPGSFNPFHHGHLDILKKAYKIFDKVIIFIAQNENKKKQDFINCYKQVKKIIPKQFHKKVKICYGDDLTIDIAKKYHCQWIIRGIRDEFDYDYEWELFNKYKIDNPEIGIVYFMSDKKNNKLRSSNIEFN